MTNVIRFAVASVLVLTCTPAGAQGISEYGGLLGGQGKPSFGGVNGAVNQSYGNAGAQFGAIPSAGTIGGAGAPIVRIDPEQAAAYGKYANDAYLEGLKLSKKGKNAEAAAKFSYAIQIRERIWGDKDPALLKLVELRAEANRKLGKLKPCEDDYRRLLGLQIRRYGAGEPELAPTLHALGDLCEKQGEAKEAINFYKQWIGIRTRHEPVNAASLKEPRLSLADKLYASGDLAGAEELYKQAIAAEDASTPPNVQLLSRALTAYSGLLRATNRSIEAEPLAARLQQLTGAANGGAPAMETTAVSGAAAGSPPAGASTAAAGPK
jgi:tetratricopeptide (TPR) repeat protein